jgi:hypothetical protein
MLLPPSLRESSGKTLSLLGVRSIEEHQARHLLSILLSIQTTN